MMKTALVDLGTQVARVYYKESEKVCNDEGNGEPSDVTRYKELYMKITANMEDPGKFKVSEAEDQEFSSLRFLRWPVRVQLDITNIMLIDHTTVNMVGGFFNISGENFTKIVAAIEQLKNACTELKRLVDIEDICREECPPLGFPQPESAS